MGILEVHFHESEFDFSPSMQTGGDEPLDEATDDAAADTEDGTMVEPDEESGSGGLGAVVALAVLVALGTLVGLRRRRGGDDGEAADETDEAIEISA
ncbi:hypothetical protein [Halobacterium rubrum]|uniref:hypothetical protein n=1 Tax=Halobacterium TaxID=2239 RepID=UPI001F1F96C6|nr:MULTISPECIES: hypothetical protein [Halobacterium]MDH5019788.1 hypothetical protein [Halobacterium rubrum]